MFAEPAVLLALHIAWWCCRNSEIYNHQKIRDTALAGVDLHSKSDSAVPGYL